MVSTKALTRLEYIENILFWEGSLSRSDLTESFGISIPQATKDIQHYIDFAPGNMVYDKSAKQYVPGNNFQPKIISPNSTSYLFALAEISNHLNNIFPYGTSPSFYSMPYPKRLVDEEILRKITRSIRDENDLLVEYQSMSNDTPTIRWIRPHALGFDGRRWHVRAYSFKDNDFRDFNLARFLSIKDNRLSSIEKELDYPWFNDLTLKIIPHPDLRLGKKRCIELDYGMINGSLDLTVKAAFVFYIRQAFCFLDDHQNKKAEEQQIILLNDKEVAVQEDMLKRLMKTKLNQLIHNE